jgi:hypothetical protein
MTWGLKAVMLRARIQAESLWNFIESAMTLLYVVGLTAEQIRIPLHRWREELL